MITAHQEVHIPQVIDFGWGEKDNKYLSHQRMANAIIYLNQKFGVCSSEDLHNLGFSKNEVREIGPMASAMAEIEIKLTKKVPDHA